ncbi:MAG: nucleotide exchange factor GrpE [Candidatus Harrisonbacteria bacterium CG10_big_fil_rev_8_21_14_0_10_38_8]|uniref:Protein GrpE n=1 Tax=Candidatus Harrisonbacteria bacterium CG10_big_fil_rev_8_21_14_0_10_38_8 TaxID=1974582 RepID=A0A2M6WKL4_9BACT|nr:MAG: nucleotide exchange factor GrpE [Candidatus Harrisonbacteria bacterium CG10_big_fil_rev_8_21_14_0_10_38_8]
MDDIQEEKEIDETQEYLDGWKRAKAELINYKKDEDKRVQHLVIYTATQVIKEFLPVLDSFDFALNSSKDEEEKKGMILIKGQLEEVFKKQGVERIKVSVGDEFDSNIHEAMNQVDIDDKKMEGKIVGELIAGYVMNGQTIRPAKVTIGKIN